MGVDGLWKLVDPVAEVCTLHELNLRNGFTASNKRNILRIGVDISVVFNECIAAEHASGLYRHNPGGALRIFFFKLCRFLRDAATIIVFVFDGPARPTFKHGRYIDTNTEPEWASACKQIIDAFGFHWHQAPGEAEAELAMMSNCDAIDVILSSDSDCLVFGARNVIRHVKDSMYMLYAADCIENMDDNQSLSHSDLLLYALLSKSDYSAGLVGCGMAIASSLVCTRLGSQLVNVFSMDPNNEQPNKLNEISIALQSELFFNRSGLLGSAHPALGMKMNTDIISLAKIGQYLRPVVSDQTQLPVWIAKEPNINRISSFCCGSLSWSPHSLESKIQNILWPGIALRMLTSPLLMYDEVHDIYMTPRSQAKIIKVTKTRRRGAGVHGEWARVQLNTDNFRRQLASPGLAVGGDNLHSIRLWMPFTYLPDEIAVSAFISKSSKVGTTSKTVGPSRRIARYTESTMMFFKALEEVANI